MELKEWIFHKKCEDERFTQKRFAEKLRMNYMQVSRIVNKKVVPLAETAYDIAKATDDEIEAWEDILLPAILEKRKKTKRKPYSRIKE